MDQIPVSYKTVGERRYRETSGLYWEDFEPGDVFEHRPGRTVLDVHRQQSKPGIVGFHNGAAGAMLEDVAGLEILIIETRGLAIPALA